MQVELNGELITVAGSVLTFVASAAAGWATAKAAIKNHAENFKRHENRMDKADANITELTASIASLRDYVKETYVPRPEVKEMFAGVHKSLDEVKDNSVALLDMLRDALRLPQAEPAPRRTRNRTRP